MLSKKSVKVVSIIMMVAMLLIVMGSSVFAAVTIPGASDPDTSSVDNVVSTVFGVIRWGGIIAAIVVGMFIGIKFITASPEGKAEIKKTAGFYVAGIVILLAASTIVTVIANSIKPGTVAQTTASSSVVTTIEA